MNNFETVIIERELNANIEKVWKAITQEQFINEWLMQNDFLLEQDHKFTLKGDWGSVECIIIDYQEPNYLAYSWVGLGIDTIVNFNLSKTTNGTLLKMTQSGFKQGQEQAANGAKFGWSKFLDNLSNILKGI